MTAKERSEALGSFGLTPRQAAFVATVALHGGYCLRRHYCTFAQIPYGKNVRDFLDGLVTRQLARRVTYRADRGYLYHLHHRALYRALEQEDNRNRRPAGPALIARKLMLLDLVLSEPDVEWYATERDKVALFVERLGISPADLPQRMYQPIQEGSEETTRYFVDKLPIYVAGEPPIAYFVYLVTDVRGQVFEQWLCEYDRLLSRLPRWVIVAVYPGHVKSFDACEAVFARHRARREPAGLRWYFATRRAVEQEQLSTLSVVDLNRFRAARRQFATPHFDHVYRDWLRDGDVVLRRLRRQAESGQSRMSTGALQTRVLPHRYEQFGGAPGVC